MKDEFLEHNMIIYIRKIITGDFYSEKIIDEFKFFYYKLFWLFQNYWSRSVTGYYYQL